MDITFPSRLLASLLYPIKSLVISAMITFITTILAILAIVILPFFLTSYLFNQLSNIFMLIFAPIIAVIASTIIIPIAVLIVASVLIVTTLMDFFRSLFFGFTEGFNANKFLYNLADFSIIIFNLVLMFVSRSTNTENMARLTEEEFQNLQDNELDEQLNQTAPLLPEELRQAKLTKELKEPLDHYFDLKSRLDTLDQGMAVRKNGCNLHRLSSFPQDKISYVNSYILVHEDLYFINAEGNEDKLYLESGQAFIKQLNAISSDGENPFFLSPEQFANLLPSYADDIPGIYDEVIAQIPIHKPLLCVKQVEIAPGKWQAIPGTTKIVDEKNLKIWLLGAKPVHPQTREEIKNPHPHRYKIDNQMIEKPSRYVFPVYTGYSQELDETIATIRAKLNNFSPILSISNVENTLGIKSQTQRLFSSQSRKNSHLKSDDLQNTQAVCDDKISLLM